jgi:hypothetical protein
LEIESNPRHYGPFVTLGSIQSVLFDELFCLQCKSEAESGLELHHLVMDFFNGLIWVFQEYIRNYGGVVCFSCRAFFRRVYQVSEKRFSSYQNGCFIHSRVWVYEREIPVYSIGSTDEVSNFMSVS